MLMLLLIQVQRFILALTHGGPGGDMHRAIDLHSHNVTRYVGDMLAWMHQALAGEVCLSLSLSLKLM